MKLVSPLVCLFALLTALNTWSQEAKPYPVPEPLAPEIIAAPHIQRTMTLLATSTPEHRHTVKILFYGQSITEQEWSKEVERDLRERFPHADLIVSNKAIGGFAAQKLVRTAEHDLYPFYPDLMIFHVYGDHTKYEEIIATTRRRTTAEIAMGTDHLDAQSKPNEQGVIPDEGWTGFMAKFLPETAKKYNCELLEIRKPWKRYVLSNQLTAQDLLKDGVHLNDHGNYLMAELVKRQLVYNPDLPKDEWQDLVRTYEVGQDIQWQDGALRLEFEGNRVDVIAKVEGGVAKKAVIRIDGKKPSEFPGAYAYTRPSSTVGVWWPGIMRVSWEKPLVLEEWKAVISDISTDQSTFKFKIIGTMTGEDGEGISTERFVSNSGRVMIEPSDWHLKPSFDYSKKPTPEGYEIKWKAVPLFQDEFIAPEITDPTKEYATIVAQNIPNETHVLEIRGEGEKQAPIAAIRVYCPPLK